MPRTKPKPRPTPPTQAPPAPSPEATPPPEASLTAVNGPAGEILTLAEAAAYLRIPEREVSSLVHSQGLPGRLIAGEWRFLKAAIQQWLATGTPTWETRKAAILEMAGKYKDDPFLEQIVEDAYRRRGRPITEDGSYKNFSS
jgi:excisionase family DNA binding protein